MKPEGNSGDSIAERVKQALHSDGFILYGQDIMPLADAGHERPLREILIRFREEEEKMMPPGTFFPILEENGLLPDLDRWVVGYLVKRAVSTLAANPGLPLARNSVNLSADTTLDAGFADFVRSRIDGSGLPTGTVSFELTWHDAMRHAKLLQGLMAQLKPVGCDFTIAGFDGSGPAFTIVSVLRPNFVKFNYGLVQNIARSLADSEKAEAVNWRCREMGIKTIAEHVETAVVLEHLKLIGVDYAQGLVISPPKPLT